MVLKIWEKKHWLVTGFLLLALGALTPRAAQAFIHCVGDWYRTDACTFTYGNDLQRAMQMSVPGDEIWVTKGTYKPTVGTNRSETFQLKSGVALYGGFSGGDTDRQSRNWLAHDTILSGDIGASGDASDNSYHVVTGSGTDWSAILDCFVITGGKANGSGSDGWGGGMYNSGGSPTLSNVIFRGNTSTQGGGGMYNSDSSPTLTNTVFFGNTSTQGGGGMLNLNSSPTLYNVTFSRNESSYGAGAGIFNYSSSPTIVNSILWGDFGTEEIYDYGSSPYIAYSLVEGGYDGGDHIMDEDPLFRDEANGNLYLMFDSPAIDAGSNSLVARDFTDMDGNGITNETAPMDLGRTWRIAGPSVDMGAYEYPYRTYENSVLCVGTDITVWTGNSACDRKYADLKLALLEAGAGSEIWVAQGTYKPTTGTSRTATFKLKTGVAIYGGFTGSETTRSERNWETHPTILSGDIGTQGDQSDNSYHVVSGSGTDGTSILDGFVITGGKANGSDSNSLGGGMYNYGGSPTLSNLIFNNNKAEGSDLNDIGIGGGGMYNHSSSPTLSNVTFSGNTTSVGGGMCNYYSSPTLSNVTFGGNTTSVGGGMCNYYSSPTLSNVTFGGNRAVNGGGMYNRSSSPTLSNVIFSGNTAITGGGMSNHSSSPTLSNVTVSGNTAMDGQGGGMSNFWGSSPTLSNCIFWGDRDEIHNENGSSPTVTYSLVQGGYAGVGNIDADPLFVDGNLRLRAGSPAIDSGNSSLVARDFADLDGDGNTSEPVPYDLAGRSRINGSSVDMGAYEHAFVRCVGNDWVPTNRACKFIHADLQEALPLSAPGDEIWVEKGTYKPTSGADRTATFQLKTGVTLYGGFTGSETALGDRNWAANPTILSGDIGTQGNQSDNSHHVVTAVGTLNTAILDGFVITGGNANGPGPNSQGGGLFSFAGSQTLSNLTFRNNSASSGGGMFNFGGGSPTLSNAIFSGNTASSGGGMFNDGPVGPTLSNVTFNGNSASSSGGGIYNSSIADMQVFNCILWGNDGGEIHNDSSSPTVAYSLVRGGYGGEGNLDGEESPFVDAANGDLRLLGDSPAVNAGSLDHVAQDLSDQDGDGNTSELTPYDLGHGPRIVNGTVDMGAHEAGESPSVTATAGTGGSLDPSTPSPKTVSFGHSAHFIFNAATGHHVTSVSGCGGTAYTNSGNSVTTYSYTTGPITENCTVSASFAVNTYSLRYRGQFGIGTVSGDTSQSVSHGQDGTAVTAVPNTGRHFVRWSDGSTANPRTDTNVTADIDVEAQFAINTYTLAYTAGTGGSISGTSPQTVNHGGNGAQVTALPNTGYHFIQWSDGSTANPRTDTNVTANIAVTAQFALNQYSVTATAGTGGSLDGSTPSPQTVSYGSSANFTFNAATGYHVASVSGDCGTAFAADDNSVTTYTYTTGPISADCTVTAAFAAGALIYVNAESPAGSPDGSSWSTAYRSLPDALTAAASGSEIWVAKGVYYPDEGVGKTDNNRSSTFALKPGVAVYGGFAGSESRRGERDPADNLTVLSGDLDKNDTQQPIVTNPSTVTGNTTNAYHVVTGADQATLDGFTVTAGYGSADDGGGVYHQQGTLTLINCTFSGNHAVYGGAIANRSATLILTNCTLSANSATEQGGGLYNRSEIFSLTMTNCVLSGNSADREGGGINNRSGILSLTNCTLAGNSGRTGGGIYIGGGSAEVANSVLWGDSASSSGPEVYISAGSVTFGTSDVQGCGGSGAGWVSSLGTDGGGNIGADPGFISAAGSNYRLQAASPCKDTGNDTDIPAGVATDRDGNPRIEGTRVDMGAYEIQEALFTVRARVGAGGSLDGSTPSPKTVLYGYYADFTFNAATGNHVASVSGCNGAAYTGSGNAVAGYTYTTGPVMADCTVTATFAINSYTLTYTAGANGSITGASPQTVNHGGRGTAVTAAPEGGYHFVQWSDGSTGNPRTDTNVTGNISVTATFAINSYTLTYTAGANGSITGAGSQAVNHGGSGTAVTAVPEGGYHFVQWSDGSTANPRTDTNVTANIAVTATFAVNPAISGTATLPGVMLSYDDGGPKTVTSGAGGSYSIGVPPNWSGTVTPSLTGYTFTPSSRSYETITADQTNENYTAVKEEPTNHPTGLGAAGHCSSLTLAWTDSTGTVLPDGYLVMCNDTGTFGAPIDGTPQADDTDLSDGRGVKNVPQGTGSCTWTGLGSNTRYYFKIFPYTNSGSGRNYKTDGAPGTAEAMTPGATTWTVVNINDSGADSLRDAVDNSCSGDVIVFDFPDGNNNPHTIPLTSGPLDIDNKNLTITGTGADKLTISGNAGGCSFCTQCGRVLAITGASEVSLSALTVSKGKTSASEGSPYLGNGAGIHQGSGSTLTLSRCAITENCSEQGGGGIYSEGALSLDKCTVSHNSSATDGGGIAATGSLTLTTSTVSGNTAEGGGAGIYVGAAGNLALDQCTVCFNSAVFNGSSPAGDGGGINAESSSPVRMKNTILARNTVSSGKSGPDCLGTMESRGYNLVGNIGGLILQPAGGAAGDLFYSDSSLSLDPRLSVLANNGGFTRTHALLSGSPAIDAADPSLSAGSASDQRGVERVRNGGHSLRMDIGAFEYTVSTLAELSSFTARVLDDRVLIEWVTLAELDTVGFNVLRKADGEMSYSPITSGIIPSGGDPLHGASYRYVDTDVLHKVTYSYMLEDISSSGEGTLHGPVSVTIEEEN